MAILEAGQFSYEWDGRILIPYETDLLSQSQKWPLLKAALALVSRAHHLLSFLFLLLFFIGCKIAVAVPQNSKNMHSFKQW